MTWESSVTNTPFEREKQKHKYNKKGTWVITEVINDELCIVGVLA